MENEDGSRQKKILKASLEERESMNMKAHLKKGEEDLDDKAWERPKIHVKKNEKKVHKSNGAHTDKA